MQFRIDQLRNEAHKLRLSGGGNIRVHPNGFTQVDLSEVEEDWWASHQRGHSGADRRLHIWNPPGFKLPHQETVNEIHDHVFDMRSEIVKGQLWQNLYAFLKWQDLEGELEPTHEKYQAVYEKKSSSRLKGTGVVGRLELLERFPVSDGEIYEQPAFTLHDTETPLGTVVTVMTKKKVHEGDATVVCPIDFPPDNSFDRATAADPEYLWDAVEAALS